MLSDEDPNDEKDETRDVLRVLYMVTTTSITVIGMFIYNIRYLTTLVLLTIYMTINLYLVKEPVFSQYVVTCYRAIFVCILLGWLPMFYIDENGSKQAFLSQLKIKRLIKEQRNILEKLPDGLIIHQNKDIKYLNTTLK